MSPPTIVVLDNPHPPIVSHFLHIVSPYNVDIMIDKIKNTQQNKTQRLFQRTAYLRHNIKIFFQISPK